MSFLHQRIDTESGPWLLAWPGPRFNIKISSYQYRKSHCGDKTILRPSYLHKGISYSGKMSFLYWIGPQDIIRHDTNCRRMDKLLSSMIVNFCNRCKVCVEEWYTIQILFFFLTLYVFTFDISSKYWNTVGCWHSPQRIILSMEKRRYYIK